MVVDSRNEMINNPPDAGTDSTRRRWHVDACVTFKDLSQASPRQLTSTVQPYLPAHQVGLGKYVVHISLFIFFSSGANAVISRAECWTGKDLREIQACGKYSPLDPIG